MTEQRSDLGDRTVVAVGDPTAPPASMTVGTPEEVSVPVLDRGFLYGDAAFETLRCYDGRPALLDRHVDRLATTLETLSIPVEPTVPDLRERVDRLLAALAGGTPAGQAATESTPETAASGDADGGSDDQSPTLDAYVRYSITRGDRTGVLTPADPEPRVVAVATPLSTRRYGPADVETVGETRHDAALYRHKTHNYLPGVLARIAAEDADEALLRAADGGVASGASSNVFVLRGDTLVTPERAVRHGVTREVVLSLAAEMGLATRTAPVDSLTGDGVSGAFLTNSTWGVRPIQSVDGQPVPRSETVAALADRYLDRVVP